MSEVKVDKISPRSGTDVTLGDASDTFTLPASATLDVNGTLDLAGSTMTGFTIPSGQTVTVASSGEIDIASGATLDVNGTLDLAGSTMTGFTIPSGQTLTVASGATINITGATQTGFPSGGLQHITTVATTTDSSSIDIPGCFSSTYQNYLVVMNNIMPVTNSTNVFMQFGNSNLSTIRPAYQYVLSMYAAGHSGGSFNYSANGTTTGVKIANSMESSILYGINMSFWIYAPYESTTYTAFSGQGETFNNSANWGNTYICTGSVYPATQDESLRIIAQNGNMDGNTLNRISVYGLAES